MNRKILTGFVGLGLIAGLVAARPCSSWKCFDGGTAVLAGMQSTIAKTPQGADKLAPNPEDAPVASIVAKILATSHYNRHPLDEETSSKLLDRYLDTLDPLHLYFTQEDLAEFEPWRKDLAEQISRKGDTGKANVIFVRFLKRFDDNVTFVNDLLKNEKFTFTGDEKYLVDRKNEPRPKDLAAAHEAWKQRLRYEYLQEKLNKQKPEEIVKTLTKRYERNARALHELDHDDIFEFFLTSLSQVFDPHTGYMGKASLANFNIQMRLSLAGIGAQLKSEDGYATIAELIPGGPAVKGGQLKVGDKVVAVAQGSAEPVDVQGMKIDNVVEKIRGPKGTEVRLTVIPASATDTSIRKKISIVRDEVKLVEQEAKAKVVDVPDGPNKNLRLGVIDLPSFYEDVNNRDYGGKSTTTDVRKLVDKLKKEHVDGIVLDLRRNPGGSLTEAINCTGLFIKDGPVVQVKSSNGRLSVDEDPDPKMQYGGPLIVLTSKLSASASEILAGALQDYGRAVIVGDNSTHGKGTVQSLIQLAPIMQDRGVDIKQDPGALKLTIQKFYRPSGSSTQLKGVASDIQLPSILSVADIGEKSLPNPLPWDTVAPANGMTRLNYVTPYLGELRARSESRTAADKDFQLVKQEVTRFQKTLANKLVSLNEEQRLKEKADAEALADTRKKLAQEHAAQPQKVSTLTLSDVEKPGLPEFKVEKAPKPKAAAQQQDPDSADEPSDVVNDVALREAERILTDLIHLSTKTTTTAAVTPKKK